MDLISGDPRPTDNISGSGGRPGYSTVTATTVDENDVQISKEINVVFSTQTALISATPTTFDLDPNGGASFTYTVTDLNGNPMAAGTQITVKAGQGIEVTGDSDFTLGNHLFPGQGATEFNFSIRDTDNVSSDPADLTIKISVTSPSGNTTTYTGISGTRRKHTEADCLFGINLSPPPTEVGFFYGIQLLSSHRQYSALERIIAHPKTPFYTIRSSYNDLPFPKVLGRRKSL